MKTRNSICPLLELVATQSHCKTLMTQLACSGRDLPRYDYISDPTTGLVAAQVTLDDGTMFHTPLPCKDREGASEGAARSALEGMGLLPVEGGRGQGRRGRGKGRDHENKQQQQHVEMQKQEQGTSQAGAGTDQMDRGLRNKGEKQKQQQANIKPAFVPLQVSRKAVKSKEKEAEEELVMPKLEEVQREAVKEGKAGGGKGVAGKESTPQRAQGRGAAKRKPRIAANFGGVPPQ